MILRPVLVRFSSALPRRARGAEARAAARAALAESARSAGARLDGEARPLPKDARGAPLPLHGWHWSLADTIGLAAGLVARVPVAIDAEWLGRPRWEAARARFAETGELERLGADDRPAVLALWTAKEALLKLRGSGLADLGHCALVAVQGQEFWLAHRGRTNLVRVLVQGEHLLAVACDEPFQVECHELDHEVVRSARAGARP